MDNKLIATAIITFVVTGILAPFSKSIFDKIFAAYNPNPKKITYEIKRVLIFTCKYILPVANLFCVYFFNKTVNKFLVLATAITFSVLVLNIFIDILNRFFNGLLSKENGLINKIISLLNLNSENSKLVFTELEKMQGHHFEITERLSELVIKNLTNKEEQEKEKL